MLSLDRILTLPDMKWSIKSILPEGKIMMLGGPPKKGKSRLILDTILRGVQGYPAFGQFDQQYGRVLVYNAEGGVQAIKMRAGMFSHLHKCWLSEIVVTSERPMLTTNNGQVDYDVVNELAYAWEGFDLVILDPLVSFHHADENSNSQMGAIFDALRDISESTKTSLIVVHHTGKMSGDETQVYAKAAAGGKLRGASAIHGAIDSAVMAWPTVMGMTLVYDLRYAENPGETHLAVNRLNGRFVKIREVAPKMFLPCPHDFAREIGYDRHVYQRAFNLTPEAANSIMEKAKYDKEYNPNAGLAATGTRPAKVRLSGPGDNTPSASVSA